MARHSTETLLPESSTGSQLCNITLKDFQSYVTHFELLPLLQKWQRKETLNEAETEIDERPHFLR